MAPSAVPKMMEVPSGPRTMLLVGRAASRDRRCPVSGFQSCTALPNPAKIIHPFLETLRYRHRQIEVVIPRFAVSFLDSNHILARPEIP